MQIERPPTLEGPSPLRTLDPLTFRIEVLSEAAGKSVQSVYAQNFRYTLAGNPGDLVRSAIAEELVRNGHRVLADQDATEENVLLAGVVADCHVRKSGYMQWTFEPVVSMTLHVARGAEPRRVLLSKEYKGTAEQFRCVLCPAIWGQYKIAEELTLRTLRNLVRDITMDPAFLAALRECGSTEKAKPQARRGEI